MEDFVRAHTTLAAVPYVPEVRLHLLHGARPSGDDQDHELYDLWERMGRLPFWACAWAGGQALARHVLDHPEIVRGRGVLDLACGSGLVAIAAAKAGAARVRANDVDPHALAATVLNAEANDVEVTVVDGDLLDSTTGDEIVLVGDAFYERALAERIMPFLSRARDGGAEVLAGDAGRLCSYLPRERFEQTGRHAVPAALENAALTETTIWRLL
ncbi:50S ribosomal protein L11 methyltransferase [Planotetraspora thailandica]|uniref:50S ribosomal protein L11 methyltransferase n=1 Tax=Planotetraspora thailandica TaxID=487172 RepID=A0A8J3Y014_9ACTN|nr:50S ribosomal protein L11 methyltransferase [Planotetraspora thailandica]GII58314.1 50S ribosomal protein L11 methyltransferase [Planotetraspora thailandica]